MQHREKVIAAFERIKKAILDLWEMIKQPALELATALKEATTALISNKEKRRRQYAALQVFQVPIVCGDLKEAITIFDRETLTIDISSSAGKLWETDQTGIKVRERLDIKAIDEEAIVMAEHTIKTTTDVQQTAAQSATEETKTYTQAEIEKMSRENIIALGTQLGYTMTTTASDEKSAVVADFMAQQTAAQNK